MKRLKIVLLAFFLLASCANSSKAQSSLNNSSSAAGGSIAASSYVAPKTKDDVISFLKNQGKLSGNIYQYTLTTRNSPMTSNEYLGYDSSSAYFHVGYQDVYVISSTDTRNWIFDARFSWGSINKTEVLDSKTIDQLSVGTFATKFSFHDCSFDSSGDFTYAEAYITSNPLRFTKTELQTLFEGLEFYYGLALTHLNRILQSYSLPTLR
jgi:hypothetical protein